VPPQLAALLERPATVTSIEPAMGRFVEAWSRRD
jgi:hypothetical protein